MPDSELPPLSWKDEPVPLNSTTSASGSGLASAAGTDSLSSNDVDAGGFLWPTPPFSGYPPASAQVGHEDCQIEGLNGRLMNGRMSFFVPEEHVAQIQVPPARTTMPLRFSQFRTLLLLRPVHAQEHAQERAQDADASALLNQPEPVTYRITFTDGAQSEGKTMGSHETDFGIFLFPPVNERGTVQRLFVAREVISRCDVGDRIGDVLVNHKAVTSEQVEQAVAIQTQMRQQKLGDILLTQQVVTPEQLLLAIEQQGKMPMVRIGEALVALGLVTELQLNEALEQQKRDRSVPLGELLVNMGLVSRIDLQTALARKMGYPLVNLEKFPIEAVALRKVPFNVAHRLMAVPLLLRDGSLVVALEDPSIRLILSELEFITQSKVVPVLAQSHQLEWALKDAYSKIGADVTADGFSRSAVYGNELDMEMTSSDQLMEDLEKQGQVDSRREDDSPIEQSDNSLVRLINTMIIEAHGQGVSDIHVESYPGKQKVKIRFRKDGALLPYLELPHNYRSAMIARIKIMCDLDISERRKPQDGKINFARFVPQHKIELRVAVIPTNNGMEDIVMRILASAKPLPLENIGLSPINLSRLKEAMERPYGLVLCVGPTGSGKTTTLHSALSFINVPERKIWTAEDPVEITQPGLRQVQVNPKIDWTFAKALRAFLRADPDVIMVGEMRDGETASMGVEASLTGHLVLSTLHTNSAPETVTRLLDMGLDPFNFADSLLVVLAQRLVRRLCSQCKVSEPATPEDVDLWLRDYLQACPKDQPAFAPEAVRAEWLSRFATEGKLMKHHAPGCSHCGQTGYRGRAGLHELMAVGRELRHMIQTGARAEQIQQQALIEGMRTLRQDGIEKVLMGITSMEEVRATSNV